MPRKRTPSPTSSPARAEACDGYTYDQARADRVVRFLQTFVTMSKGRQWAGQPMKLMDWQIHDVIEPLFGWVDDEGLRRYRRAYIEVPKKNGKSSLMAGLVLYFLLADGEPGAEVYGAAVDRIQAGLIYREVAQSVRRSPRLSAVLDVVDSRSTIVHKASGSRYTCLAADSWRAEGINASAVIIDELHAHKKRDLVDALLYAGAARSQPMTIAISTAGHDRNSICWQWHTDTELVQAKPSANPSFYGKIYAAAPDDDFSDPKVWAKANPSMGLTISAKDFAADYIDAKTNPSKFSSFLRYRLDVWTEADNRWFNPDTVAACQAAPVEPLDGKPCWLGIDLASTLDVTCAAFVTRSEDQSYDVELLAWIPEQTAAERERRDRIPYLTWIREGWIKATEGCRCDYVQVAADIMEHVGKRPVRQAGIDPWQHQGISTALKADGLDVQIVPQSIGTMTAPSKLLESLIATKKIRFSSPVWLWMANNACSWTDSNGNLKLDKGKSHEKVDGIAATINALALSMADASVGRESWEMIEI